MSDNLLHVDRAAEWLEADGLGGYAMGTVDGVRTRRYHATLLAAATPPTGRVALVQGLETWIEGPGGAIALSSQRYAPDVVHPDGATRLVAFSHEPWPRWSWRLPDGALVEHELFVPKGAARVVLRWRRRGARSAATLCVRPLLSGRDAHALHHENPAFRFDSERAGDETVRWRPYADVPAIEARSNGEYAHAPEWYRNFLYAEERARGLDFVEDLASPGTFRFDLARGEAVLVLSAELAANAPLPPGDAAAAARRLRDSERRRRARFADPLARAADAYVVRRGEGRTIVAGYPWFTDWGRDTFIALRGLCLATGRLADAGAILGEWAGTVSEGMLPNLFVDGAAPPEYNSVDASLWYVIAVHDYLAACAAAGVKVTARARARLETAVGRIVAGYAAGTRFGIRADADGLLACGTPGVQLTWMDAKVGDWVVTPRTGKPVEVQALWINALRIASAFAPEWRETEARARAAFLERFWNDADGTLHDVVDVDHVPGAVDRTFRPNQVFALGGLPYPLVEGARAHRVLTAFEARLLTPLGPRSLAPGEPGYTGRYEGGVLARDGSYHQGTVWPWLAGAFVEAWLRARGHDAAAREEAVARFVRPLRAHLAEAGLGHVSEIADGARPHTPRGCPFQAWSVGELLRIERLIAPAARKPAARTATIAVRR